MKKSLFLLPLLSVFVLAGCKVTLFGTTISIGENDNSGTGTGTGGGSGNGGGSQTGGGSSFSDLGTAEAVVTMMKKQDMTSAEDATTAVFENNGYSVEVSVGSNTSQTVADAVKATGNYEFRIYAKMDLTFKGSSFSKLLIKFSTYTQSSGTSYYFDYDGLTGATNEYNTTSGEALLTLDSAASEYTVNCWHQTRIASVAFYK